MTTPISVGVGIPESVAAWIVEAISAEMAAASPEERRPVLKILKYQGDAIVATIQRNKLILRGFMECQLQGQLQGPHTAYMIGEDIRRECEPILAALRLRWKKELESI